MIPRWALLTHDGERHQGKGPESGLNHLVDRARVIALQFPGLPPIYISRPAIIKWSVAITVGQGETGRFWGLSSDEGRTWVWPDGSMIGIGVSVEDVEEARSLLSPPVGVPLPR